VAEMAKLTFVSPSYLLRISPTRAHISGKRVNQALGPFLLVVSPVQLPT